jgi:hypothetical protein
LKNKIERQKHNYTSELELKSLLIRIKNKRKDNDNEKYNKIINKYILWHTKISNEKYSDASKLTKKKILRTKLKFKIINLSEKTSVNDLSYERFGEIILLMIKNILKKPQFSGYTYRDDFYSDAIYKILKYLDNFNHLLISDVTGQPVNSFAYISQIIHNSILFIINTKKKENEYIKKQVSLEMVSHNLTLKNNEELKQSTYEENYKIDIVETIHIHNIKNNLIDEIEKLNLEKDEVDHYDIFYPKEYRISFEEYNNLKPFLKGKVSIIKEK